MGALVAVFVTLVCHLFSNAVDYAFLQDKGNLNDITFSLAEEYTVEYGRENDWTLRYRRGVQEGSNENVVIQDKKPERFGYSTKGAALYHLPPSRFIKDDKGNFIDPINNDFNNTDSSETNHISLSGERMDNPIRITRMDQMDETTAYMELIRENIDYDIMMSNKKWSDREMYDELYQQL